jgi:hypothetical protein
MRHCIIHIGMHKTGSSSIQRSLTGFEDERFVYAPIGKEDNHSIPICTLFVGNRERHVAHKSNMRDMADVAAYRARVRAGLESAIERTQERALIISGEDISSLSRPDLDELHRYFDSHFDRIDIVAYVRSPAGFMSSAFQQRVKGRLDRFEPEAQYFNYEKCFSKFDVLFGRDNVHLWHFSPESFPGGCVVQDFCARLGINLPKDRIIRSNESLSRHAVALLYCYRKLGKKYGSVDMPAPEGQRLGKILGALGAGKFRLSPDLIRPILKRHRADIEWMEARLGQPLSEELGYHQPGDVRDESDLLTPDPDAVRELIKMLGELAPAGSHGETPEQVASLVHLLRTKEMLPAQGKGRRRPFRSGAVRNTGKVMLVKPNAVLGWAIGGDFDQPVRLALLVNGREVACSVADQDRPALKAQGIHPTGRCGFAFRFRSEQMLQTGDKVTIRPLDGDFLLVNSPYVVDDADTGTEAGQV